MVFEGTDKVKQAQPRHKMQAREVRRAPGKPQRPGAKGKQSRGTHRTLTSERDTRGEFDASSPNKYNRKRATQENQQQRMKEELPTPSAQGKVESAGARNASQEPAARRCAQATTNCRADKRVLATHQ